MIATIAFLTAIGGEMEFATPKVIAATAFRNGYGFVLKEVTIPESGEVYVRDLDFPVSGTLWFAPATGTSVREVTLTYIEEEAMKSEAGTLDDLMLLNTGQTVELGVIQYGESRLKTIRGRLRSSTLETVTLEIGGKIQMIPREWVQTVSVDTDAETKLTTKVRRPVLRVRGGTGGGKLFMIGLLHGLVWSPAYHLDITDAKTMKLTMKATVMNTVADLDRIDLGMVSGFPEVSQMGQQDPLTQGVRAIFELAQTYSRPPSAFPNNGGTTGMTTGGSGGFGGLSMGAPGQGFMPAGIRDVTYDPTDNSLIVRGAEKNIRELEQMVTTSQHNDLFVYTVPGVSMKRLDRSYFVIQETEAEYDYRFVADTGGQVGEVTAIKSLVFTNKTNLPWTDAPAMIVHGEQLVGQSPMPYTVVGDEAEVRIGRATTIDVRAKSDEVARERNARTVGTGVWDLVTMRDTVTVTNFGAEPATVRVRRTVNGRVTASSDGGEWTHLPAGNDGLNSTGSGQWEIVVQPGAKRELTVEYANYVRVR